MTLCTNRQNTWAQEPKVVLEWALIIPTDPLRDFKLSGSATVGVADLEVLNPRERMFPPRGTAKVSLNFVVRAPWLLGTPWMWAGP